MLVYPILLILSFIKISPMIGALIPGLYKISERINKPNILKALGILSISIGALLGLYTGVLLSAFGARPAWNSAMLWIIFLTSGLSAAAALIHMIAKNKDERELLAKSDNVLLIIEFVLILLYLVGLLTSSQVSNDAAMLLINGKFAAIFWIFVVGIGIIIPLIIQLSAVTHRIKHTSVGPILVLFGGLMLRFIIVAVGQYSHWSSAVLK
jgi:formate-dependent nitrite reductase membrane component NrfD